MAVCFKHYKNQKVMKRFFALFILGLVPFIIFSQVNPNKSTLNRNKTQPVNVKTVKNIAKPAPRAFFTANLPNKIDIDKFIKVSITINPRGIGTYGTLILPDNPGFVYRNFVLPDNVRKYRINNAYYLVWSPMPQNVQKVTFDFKVKRDSINQIPRKINLNYVFAFFKNTQPGQAVIKKSYKLEYAYVVDR